MKRYKDLGGIKNKEGKAIRSNMLFRASNLNKLSRREIKEFINLGLSKIIDLRTDVEANEKPDSIIENVEYNHIPIFNQNTLGITYEKDNGKSIENLIKNIPNMKELYVKMVTDDYSVSQFKSVIQKIVNSDKYPVLYHCTVGKDRTGITTMILFNILDIDIKEILEDYLSVNKRLELKANLAYKFIDFKFKDKELALNVNRTLIADESYLLEAIDAINKKYGDINSFIKNNLGITDEMKQNFKEIVLE